MNRTRKNFKLFVDTISISWITGRLKDKTEEITLLEWFYSKVNVKDDEIKEQYQKCLTLLKKYPGNLRKEKIKKIYLIKIMENRDYWVECLVCGTQYKNWSGSTPCCGSLAIIVEDIKQIRKEKIKKILK